MVRNLESVIPFTMDYLVLMSFWFLNVVSVFPFFFLFRAKTTKLFTQNLVTNQEKIKKQHLLYVILLLESNTLVKNKFQKKSI